MQSSIDRGTLAEIRDGGKTCPPALGARGRPTAGRLPEPGHTPVRRKYNRLPSPSISAVSEDRVGSSWPQSAASTARPRTRTSCASVTMTLDGRRRRWLTEVSAPAAIARATSSTINIACSRGSGSHCWARIISSSVTPIAHSLTIAMVGTDSLVAGTSNMSSTRRRRRSSTRAEDWAAAMTPDARGSSCGRRRIDTSRASTSSKPRHRTTSWSSRREATLSSKVYRAILRPPLTA